MSCNDCASCTGSQSCQPVRWRLDIGKLFRLFAIVSLIVAYFVGQSLNQPTWEQDLQSLYPQADIQSSESLANTWEVTEDGHTRLVVLATENSYGGPLTLATTIDGETIERVDLVAHADTPAYIQKLNNFFFFRQFENKPVDRSFQPGSDYDVITGATLSSNAIMRANATGAHYIAREVFGKQPETPSDDIELNVNHGLLALLILLVLANIRLNNAYLKTGIIVASLVVVGFMANQMINVANFSALLLGFIPAIAENPGYWILLGSVFAGIIILGRNIYCGNICPFHAVQFLLSKVGGMNLPLHPLVRRYGKNLAKIGLWAGLMVGLLTTNPASGAYEPFGMIFSLQGEGIQWYIMPAVVIGCFFVPSLFCRYLCPAGEALNRLTRMRNQMAHVIKAGRK